MKTNKLMLLSLIIGVTACNKPDFGGTTLQVSSKDSEISFDNFPHGKMGIEGNNTISYPKGFSFLALDEAMYNSFINESFANDNVIIKIRYSGKDQYGKDTVGNWISVGKISASESNKYADFPTWNGKYALFDLLQPSSVADNNNKEKEGTESSEKEHNFGKVVENPEARLSEFDPVDGVNTTIYNQSNENLKKLQWRLLEDVFFKEHLEFYESGYEMQGFKGTVINYKQDQIQSQYDIITIDDIEFGEMELYYHSFSSNKSVMRPRKAINIGDKLEGWGARLEFEGKTVHYLNQAVLQGQAL